MDSSETATVAATTTAEFSESLNELVQTAYENGVDVEGGWVCRTRSDRPDWEIVILELTKRGDRTER